ncbi:RICIN domain-containing protein [Streptomyces sp. NA04227]|uniref:RICIN domain-containing protein n=1 Tax=Streptomyces sp. NA04227 TaxID=2742136 RepID=UPI001591A7DB|nr:RICIN domain-containing protein [Streptomyces sp. NA04227]QKW08076.1 RICIN domain-containing protein [Streptomyces sp. NA04227]
MKRKVPVVAAACSAALALPISLLAAVPSAWAAAPATYHVDCAAGDDAAAGTSPATAWRTLAKASDKTYSPGDRIVFRRGTRCTGTLAPRGSGTASAPIAVDTYGTGAKPLIEGGGAPRAVVLRNQQGWEIRNLEITNKGATMGNRRAVSVELSDYGTGGHYVLENLDIHDVNGDDTKDLGGSGGIYFTVAGTKKQTKFDGVTLRGNTIRGVDREGIFFVSTWNRSGFETPSAGAFVPWPNVHITGNDLSDLGGDGIVAGNTTGALVEHNKVDGFQKRSAGYNAGMWTYDSDDAVFQYNEATGGRTHRDGMAYDVDQGTVGTVFQYNYSHDNEGGFMLLCNATGILEGAVVRHNVSQNDAHRGVETCKGEIESAEISHNTLYVGDGVTQSVLQENNTTRRNVVFRNNIVVAAGTGRASINLQSGGFTLDHNVLKGVTGAPDGAGTGADPQLSAPGTATGRTDADGYRLCTGSPALGTGSPDVTRGTRDYFGNPLPTGAPHIGADAGGGLACPPQVADGTYTLRLSGTPLALDVPDHSTRPGTQLVVWTEHAGTNQQFALTRDADGTYTVKNVHSGQCLDVEAASRQPGARVIQWTCTGSGNQRWKLTGNGDDLALIAQHSGLALTAAGAGDGDVLTQEEPKGTSGQRWAAGAR